jgi:hypothetical protein
MKWIFVWLFCLLTALVPLNAQETVIEGKEFFSKETPVEVTLNTNLKRLYASRKNTPFQPGTITWHNPDGTGDVTENINIRLRGNFRKDECGLASLMLDFKDPEKKSRFRKLGKVKMVAPCEGGSDYQQYIFKEYLIYKMYNLVTEASFKVRLLHVTIQDSLKAKKHFKEYAYVIEPVKELEKRLGWVEEEEKKYNTEQTDRANATLLFLFQYMVGNTDWSIPFYHNIKLFFPKDSVTTRPYNVAYDFDFSGLVNAPYASPPEKLGLTSVTERYYMGYVRTMSELRVAAGRFLEKEKEILNLVKDFEHFGEKEKWEMTAFLEDFFEIIKDEDRMKEHFIDNALNAK